MSTNETALALHYPYVLAFEPTFVEIRHVETGLMSQVIQGNNLRLLFADTPPSTTNTASGAVYNPHHMGYGHNQYPNAPGTTGPRHSGQNVYLPQPGYGPPANQYPPRTPPLGVGRDEILMVSDDRVLTLRTNAGTQPPFSDTASMMSIPR